MAFPHSVAFNNIFMFVFLNKSVHNCVTKINVLGNPLHMAYKNDRSIFLRFVKKKG